MSKREYPLRFICAHEGCTESVTYRYATRRDLANSYELKWYSVGKWRCIRHTSPDQVLSVRNRETRHEIVSRQTEHGRYFGNAGFVSGPGFKVFAEDFPAGTKLIVTAMIEIAAPSESDGG